MNRPELDCVRHVKLPVSDLARALTWYTEVLGFISEMEFPDERGVVRGVAGRVPGVATGLALREDPDTARGLSGFNPVSWGVQDRADVERWIAYLESLGISHSPIIEASVGWLVVFHDPDGVEHHIYTLADHGIDNSHRAGYGRPLTVGGVAD